MTRSEAEGGSSDPEELAFQSEPPITAGSCILKRPELAQIVQDAILHFEGKRYVLGTWTIMPNHVHAILKPLTGFALKDILNSWKSYSARRINANLGTSGALWERESFDHLIRDDSHLERLISYVDQNAVVAGLCDSPSEWAFSARGVGFTRSRLWFEDPRTTPFVAPRTRGELAHLHKPGGVYFVTWRLLDAVRLGRGGKSAGLETCTTKRDPE